jgi:hypothetical protein
MSVIPASQEVEVGGLPSEVCRGYKCENLSEKQTKNKRTENVTQVVECLSRRP